MKTLNIALLLVLVAALPALAQNPVDINVFASWVDAQGETIFDEGPETNFESGDGFGVSVNWFWGRNLSTELSASALTIDAGLDLGGEPFVDLGSIDLTPISLTLQYHFARDSVIDPYLGVGAAWVLVEDLESADLDRLYGAALEADDEFTYVLNAGLGIRLTQSFGLYLDGKYMPLEIATRAAGDTYDTDLQIDPMIVSAGIRLRF
ncbi:MAG: outer membrane beta-barrel protein [Acidobacteria bacterium]|nr:outer membrane beta-barrel protein [Acidobacteriota bacterium]